MCVRTLESRSSRSLFLEAARESGATWELRADFEEAMWQSLEPLVALVAVIRG